jgi:hypothetical protein
MLSTKQCRQESTFFRHRVQNTFGGNLLNAGAPKLRGKWREFKVESDCKWRVSEVLRGENALLYQ